ncbi:MAG: 6,7-dimethyl-8-ribityllumazine synthase [Candidatus Jacksonbacteria bacterium]|nr:6,7-dimethyl-8-ribityllumazine synthase [Candidatus Jacksonbacteria bacterium]
MLKKQYHNTIPQLSSDSRESKIGVVVGLFNRDLTESLENKCIATLQRAGISEDSITTVYVPGAFEIPLACQRMAKTKKYDALIALGAIIKGDTYHFELTANECARGVMNVMLKYNIPIVFEVLAGSRDHMEKRCRDDEYNKGIEAGNAAVQILNSKI